MSESKCHQCSKVFFSKDGVYRRFCCNALFHLECIRQDHMRECPACQCPSNEMLTWVPVCIVSDPDDEPRAKRRKVDIGDCVICLEAGTETNEILTTECCNQKGHVLCLRTYYELPAESCSRHNRKKVAEGLGIPNCFVCRGERENMRPLDGGVLEAILPVVRKRPPVVNADYANKGLLAWQQLIERMVKDLTLNQLYLFSLDAGKMKIRFQNDTVETRRFSGFRDLATSGTTRKELKRRLTELVYRWAGLPTTAVAFDEHTCRYFSLRGVDELVLNLTISYYYKSAKRSTRPGAPPFAVEYENTKIDTWTCTGHYFEFEDMEYHEVDDEDPYLAKLSIWHYDFYMAPTDEPKRRDGTRNIATETKSDA